MVSWSYKAIKNKGLSDNEREKPMPSYKLENPCVDVSSVYLEEPGRVHLHHQHARHLAPAYAGCDEKPGLAARPGLCCRLQALGASSRRPAGTYPAWPDRVGQPVESVQRPGYPRRPSQRSLGQADSQGLGET